ncbi:putative protein kinase [Trypanosoma vivax]|uniref:non-specific serine/threonine protein kinase n=1 Tax=Trypanosoma vivax (strain Y486) TaxID=1055687 RepID=G0U243_TRYVY|nr:putative protein kinase [Trypanosoma vivax]CCC50346.1 putative protein kinase [Trypanosoma vivax Y486]
MASSRMTPNDFKLGETVGVGAFSKVMVGQHVPTGAHYAIKLVSKQQIFTAPSEEEKKRMADVAIREARMLHMCNHPNIVRFYATMQAPHDLMYVTELCEGGELLKAIKRRQKIPLEAARYVLAELFSAVWYLHHAPKRASPSSPTVPLEPVTILHRDIKPENIMLTGNKHVRLIDFGTAVICRSVDDRPEGDQTNKGRAQTFCGTTAYMSPELLRDNYTCTASDYWACGCVLYHMLVGKRPFSGSTEYFLIQSILEKEPEYPDSLDSSAKSLISELLRKRPDQRPGKDEVQRHVFFKGVDFDNLETKDTAKLWAEKAEWVSDSAVSACGGCQKVFTFWRRRHHCRKCGNVYCGSCSSRLCTIPDSVYISPERVCDACFKAIGDI